MAKCLLKQGKFKDASVILGEANKLRDEFATQKPAEKKERESFTKEREEWVAEASATIERLDEIIEEKKNSSQ